MSGPHSAGKGDRSRVKSQEQFAANHETIRWKQEYRLIADNESHWYIIKADEVPIFEHWLAAMEGKRRMPRHFDPVRVDGPESVVFTGWRETT